MRVQSLGRSKTGPSTGDPRLSRTDMVPGLQLRTVDQAHTSAPNPIKTNTKHMNKKIMKILMVQKEQERRPSLDQHLGEPPAVLNENRIQQTDLQKKLQIIGRGMIFLGNNGQSPRPESRSIRTRGELQPTGKRSCLKTEFRTTHLLTLPPEQQHTWL